MNRYLLLFLGIVCTIQLYGRDVTTTKLILLRGDGSTNSDHTYLQRFDEISDRVKLRLNLGDESSSDFQIGYHHYNGSGWYTTFSFSGSGNGYSKGKLGIGDPSYKLSVNGTIGVKEVKVTSSGWSDFVFEPDYDLKSLDQVEAFITENGHLPDIPSAKEVSENGINLGEMNAKLLEKIEELTLYNIDLEEGMKNLERKVQ